MPTEFSVPILSPMTYSAGGHCVWYHTNARRVSYRGEIPKILYTPIPQFLLCQTVLPLHINNRQTKSLLRLFTNTGDINQLVMAVSVSTGTSSTAATPMMS